MLETFLFINRPDIAAGTVGGASAAKGREVLNEWIRKNQRSEAMKVFNTLPAEAQEWLKSQVIKTPELITKYGLHGLVNMTQMVTNNENAD